MTNTTIILKIFIQKYYFQINLALKRKGKTKGYSIFSTHHLNKNSWLCQILSKFLIVQELGLTFPHIHLFVRKIIDMLFNFVSVLLPVQQLKLVLNTNQSIMLPVHKLLKVNMPYHPK